VRLIDELIERGRFLEFLKDFLDGWRRYLPEYAERVSGQRRHPEKTTESVEE
jgi:hypothetical protein